MCCSMSCWRHPEILCERLTTTKQNDPNHQQNQNTKYEQVVRETQQHIMLQPAQLTQPAVERPQKN